MPPLIYHSSTLSRAFLPSDYFQTQLTSSIDNLEVMNRDTVDTAIEIDTFELSEVDEKEPTPKDGKKLKKRLTGLNPAKAVIGGISQSANVVKGGISQSANAVKGGITQSMLVWRKSIACDFGRDFHVFLMLLTHPMLLLI